MTRTAVLVLGGGPVGLALALEIGRHGVPVTVVEPRTIVDHTRPRAKTTSARTMEIFRRWGVAEDVRTAAAIPLGWSDRVTFCATVTGAEVTHFIGVFGLDLSGSDLVAEPGQQVTQPVIEEVLRDHVRRLPQVRLLLGHRGTAVTVSDDLVQATVTDTDGGQQIIEADYLVGADGPRSVVRDAIGAHYLGAKGGRPNVNVTFRSRSLAGLVPHPPSLHYWVLNPDAPGVVGPLDLDGTWWAIATGTASVADDAEASAIVRRLVGQDIDVEVVATDPWQARMLLVDRYRQGRAFLVGDAAHQNPPWGGHGFNTGVGDALNLGWKLAAVVQGWAPAAILDSYEAERRPIAQQTIDVAAANMATLSVDLTEPALMQTGEAFEAARARAAATVHRTKDTEFHSLGLVLGYGYTDAADAQAPAGTDHSSPQGTGCRTPGFRTDGHSSTCWVPVSPFSGPRTGSRHSSRQPVTCRSRSPRSTRPGPAPRSSLRKSRSCGPTSTWPGQDRLCRPATPPRCCGRRCSVLGREASERRGARLRTAKSASGDETVVGRR